MAFKLVTFCEDALKDVSTLVWCVVSQSPQRDVIKIFTCVLEKLLIWLNVDIIVSSPIFYQNDEQLSKLENEILLTPADDSSSYATSQPPSVAGPEWSAENSMEDFPEGFIKEEDLDTTGDDMGEIKANVSTPISADQCELSVVLRA